MAIFKTLRLCAAGLLPVVLVAVVPLDVRAGCNHSSHLPPGLEVSPDQLAVLTGTPATPSRAPSQPIPNEPPCFRCGAAPRVPSSPTTTSDRIDVLPVILEAIIPAETSPAALATLLHLSTGVVARIDRPPRPIR